MKRVLIVGAGAQGGPCASILAGEQGVQEIRLGDINFDFAEKVAQRINNPKVRPLQLDAGQKDQIVSAAQGVDFIFNFTLIKFNNLIMEAALACQANYVDTACNLDFLNRWISAEDAKYHQEFIGIGKTALVGCGFSPGIANVFTRYLCNQMDRVERIVIRVGRSSRIDEGEVVSEWKPTWSPEILLEDTADLPMVFADGRYSEVPIFSNPEKYCFPDPVGEILLSSHNHEEPYLIPRFYLDKGLQEVDFKYPVDLLAGAFVKMGFADYQAIDIHGQQVVPRDVLMKLVKKPGNSFLEESLEEIHQADITGILTVTVDGEQAGESCTANVNYVFTDGRDQELKTRLFEVYGTSKIYVAQPAVVGASLITRGDTQKGVITPDSLEPVDFFQGMAERGIPFEFEEQIIKTKKFL